LQLLLAAHYEGVTGALFLKIKKFKPIVPDASVTEDHIGKRLWELSERLSASTTKGYRQLIAMA
jgi:hypothetical protein